MSLIRVQILLEPRQLKALKRASSRSNKSVSQLLREITNTYLSEMFPEDDEVLQTLHTIKSIRERQPEMPGEILPDAYLAENETGDDLE